MAAKYKLTYFNITAYGEPIRFLCAYGGIDLEDVRLEEKDWPAIKPTMPFGQVPVLEVDGKQINQSMAICRYFGKLVKLAGKNDFEAMEIDSITDTVNELQMKIGYYAYEADEKAKEQKRKVLVEETLPYMLTKLDAIAKQNNGHLVHGELTWADMYFTAFLDYMNYMATFEVIENYPNLQAVRDNVHALPAIKAWLAKRPKTN